MIIAEQLCEVNGFAVAPDELMEIDIRPHGELAPVLDLPIALNPARVYLASLSNGSHSTMVSALNMAAAVLTFRRCDHQTCPWWLLRVGHTKALRAWLMQNRAAATGNKALSAVRGALRAAWEMEQISTDDYMRAISVKAIPGSKPEQAAGRALAPGEFAALLRVCASDKSAAGVRDAAILGLGVLGGLRRAEIAGLQVEQYRDGVLWVTGKRNKTRTVPVASGVDDVLADWMHMRSDVPGPLFLAINKGGRILGEGLTTTAIYKMVVKRAQQAGVKAFSPHDLRRTFAGDLLDAGADIATVQRLMGHSNVSTTAGYDRRGERTKRDAIGRLHMPWERRFVG